MKQSMLNIQNDNIPLYHHFCSGVNIEPCLTALNIPVYSNTEEFIDKSLSEKLTAALKVLLDCLENDNNHFERVDRVVLDYFIGKIDLKISEQLDEILHHADFQEVESAWCALDYLVKRIDFDGSIKVELLNVSKEALRRDFEEDSDIKQSGLYKQVYENEYDMPGGEPLSAIISNYEFNSKKRDVELLKKISQISAVTHCPFIASVAADFFGKSNFEEVSNIYDLSNYLSRSEYTYWNNLRESENAKYIGLACPRFLLRLPYGDDNPVNAFFYQENVSDSPKQYLWGSASFAFAVNMAKSFKEYGWAVNIRGPESGGKVEELLLPSYAFGAGLLKKIPTEILIPETRELELANLGFIPLSYYKNCDHACFFSANSIQLPATYLSAEVTANSRINARLPYVFLSARIAHYLKVLQREAIGSTVSGHELEARLNAWLKTLVTKMNNPEPEQIALHPLRDASVEVTACADNPGFYQVSLYIMPHFQIEGIDVRLSIVGNMPTDKRN